MDYKTRLEQLEDELNDRCSEIVELREHIAKQSNKIANYYQSLVEAAKKKAYAEGYEKGWQDGRADTDWNLT